MSISSIKGTLSFLASLSLFSHLIANSSAPFLNNRLHSRAWASITLGSLCGKGLSIPFAVLTSKSSFFAPLVSSSIFGSSSSLLSSSIATLLNPFGLACSFFCSFFFGVAFVLTSSVMVMDSSSVISVTSVLSFLAYLSSRPFLASLRSLLTSLLSGYSSKMYWKSSTASW